MITGTELKVLIRQGICQSVMATRTHGTIYSVLVYLAQCPQPDAISQPGTDEVYKFDSLDEVVSFLSQIGVKSFQVEIWGGT